jgi:hypothetical protein
LFADQRALDRKSLVSLSSTVMSAILALLYSVSNRTGCAPHPRSDRHSKVACWGIAFDLLLTSALLRRHVSDAKVVLGVNQRMVDFSTGRAKNLDRVFARPGGAPVSRALRSLADHYGVALGAEQRSLLGELPDWPTAPTRAVLVALEAKAAMTAFIRALPQALRRAQLPASLHCSSWTRCPVRS